MTEWHMMRQALIMLNIEPQLLLKAIEVKDIVRFLTPFVYDDRIEQNTLNQIRIGA